MDAIKCVKEWTRMCAKHGACENCPIMSENGMDMTCNDLKKKDPEKFVSIIEKWSEEHPVKKRQDKLLEAFPNAQTVNGAVTICPKAVDPGFKCNFQECIDCAMEYWLNEVEDDR